MGEERKEARHRQGCIRFKKLDDLALEVLGEAIRRLPAKTYIEAYEKTRG